MRPTNVLLGSIAVLMALVVPAAAIPPPATPPLPIHYGLGDSWAAGEGTDHPKKKGYMALAHDAFRDEFDCSPATVTNPPEMCRRLRLVNLGRSATDELRGVRTIDLIQEQLPLATADIEARNSDDDPGNDVEVVVLTVGGNDGADALRACGQAPAQCQSIIQTMLLSVATNLNVILGGLREAAGDATAVVITTYDNAIPFCPLGDDPQALALSRLVLPLLNDVIRGVAAAHGAHVADVEGLLDNPTYWVGDCLHLTAAGHAVVAEQVVEAATG